MRENKGITLIVLVITIIIMLILAGVTINLALGENGLIGYARNAKEDTKRAEANDQKLMEDNLQISGRTIDDWVKNKNQQEDTHESTVTLLASSQGFTEGGSSGGGTEGGVWYAINGDSNFTKVTTVPYTIENVDSIRFYATAGGRMGTTKAAISDCYEFNEDNTLAMAHYYVPSEIIELNIEQDTTFYLTDYGSGLPELS